MRHDLANSQEHFIEGVKEQIVTTRTAILRVSFAGLLIVLMAMFLMVLYACSGFTAEVWRAWSNHRRKVEAYEKQTLALVCDGVHFANMYAPNEHPGHATYIGENTTAGAVGHGVLFVKIKGGPPKRFADLTIADVEGIKDMRRTTRIEEGREVVDIGDDFFYHMSLTFDKNRLISGMIKNDMDELVFCDKTGKKEFKLADTFEHIKKVLGEGNYEETHPKRGW